MQELLHFSINATQMPEISLAAVGKFLHFSPELELWSLWFKKHTRIYRARQKISWRLINDFWALRVENASTEQVCKNAMRTWGTRIEMGEKYCKRHPYNNCISPPWMATGVLFFMHHIGKIRIHWLNMPFLAHIFRLLLCRRKLQITYYIKTNKSLSL